jgi:CRISPR-associated protein Csx17
MTERRDDIDWGKTTFDGSRREQLRRGQAMSLRQRLEALDQLTDLAARMQAMPRHGDDAHVGGTSAGVHEEGGKYALGDPVHTLTLEGCTPTPLASYLKALGILRLVAEQADRDACGYWMDDVFVLQTTLDREELLSFFLDAYQPTPILAPWNGGSGFYPGDNQSGMEPICHSAAPRLATLRGTIAAIREVLARSNIEEKPDLDTKLVLLRHLRNHLDERALVWLDAATLLSDDKPLYPPLLGTGGNDGRLDFTNNFLQRLVSLIDCKSGGATLLARQQLPESLFGIATPGQVSAAIGQFSPGGAGGPNGTTGFDSKSGFNPWDFVFMLEGAVLFAAAATRRLESDDKSALSYPFTVRTTGSSDGNTAPGDESAARAEIWMPLWDHPTSLDELRALLSEGRATLHRRPARDGLDFVRAVSQLGVQRGIRSFQRYGFLMRSGKAYLATPLNRIQVERNPAADLINELDDHYWLQRFRSLARRNETPARLRSLVRRLEDALFDLSRFPGPHYVQQVLIVLGLAQGYLASSPGAREHCPPVPRLKVDWSFAADDGSAPFRVAAALAGLHLQSDDEPRRPVMPMVLHFAPVDQDMKAGWPKDPNSAAMVWHTGDLSRNLYAVAQRRLLDAQRGGDAGKPFAHFATASLAHIADWLASPTMDTQVDALLRGLVLARIPRGFAGKAPGAAPLPAAFAVLKPLFCTDQQLRDCGLLATDARLPLELAMLKRLWSRADDAMRYATRRLLAAGLHVDTSNIDATAVDSRRLLAALLIPIANEDLKRLLKPLQPSTRDNEPELATA